MWRHKGAVVSTFQFTRDDIVIASRGSCAAAAIRCARRSGATIIHMRNSSWWRRLVRACTDWRRLGQDFESRRSVAANEALFRRLGERVRRRSKKRARLFVAGDMGDARRNLVRVLWISDRLHADAAPADAHHMAIERRLRWRLTPTSLHDIWRADPIEPLPVHPEPSLGPEIRAAIARLDRAYFDHDPKIHRPPRDPVAERHATAVATAYLERIDAVVIRPFLESAFDAAYFDAALAADYGEEQVRRIILMPGMILIEPAQVLDTCRRYALELSYAGLG